MTKHADRKRAEVREPVQAYLTADESGLLSRLATETGLSKAEIIRQGIRSFARDRGGESPMLRFLGEAGSGEWPEAIGADHDAILAEEYRSPSVRRRR